MSGLFKSRSVVGFAGMSILFLGWANATAQVAITAEGNNESEQKNLSPGVSLYAYHSMEAELYFSDEEGELKTTRVFDIDDSHGSFFMHVDCRFEATSITLEGAFEHFVPPPHRLEYEFSLQGTVTYASESSWQPASEFTVSGIPARAKVVDILEPPPAPRDSLEIYFQPEQWDNPLWIDCSIGGEHPFPRILDVTVNVNQ